MPLATLRKRLCSFCCWTDPVAAPHVEMPPELREASHNQANAAAAIVGSVASLRREADKLEALVLLMRGEDEKDDTRRAEAAGAVPDK
jgi:hypothetical protein